MAADISYSTNPDCAWDKTEVSTLKKICYILISHLTVKGNITMPAKKRKTVAKKPAAKKKKAVKKATKKVAKKKPAKRKKAKSATKK